MIHLRQRRDKQRVHTGSGKRDRAYQPGRTGADDGHFRGEDFGSGRVGHGYPAILSVKRCAMLWVTIENPAIKTYSHMALAYGPPFNM
jgi:hypothetical protein